MNAPFSGAGALAAAGPGTVLLGAAESYTGGTIVSGGSLAIGAAQTNTLGLTLSSFFVAFALGQVLAGPLSDRFGRKWMVLGGLAVFAAGSVVCAFADWLSFLVLGRVIQALGACAASVLSRAIARDLFDGEELARR